MKEENKLPIHFSIAENSRVWAEQYYLWFVKYLGKSDATKLLYYPTSEDFPFDLDGTTEKTLLVIQSVAEKFQIDFKSISVKFLSNGFSKKWNILKKAESNDISQSDNEIHLSQHTFHQLEPLIASTCAELAYVKLLQKKLVKESDTNNDLVAELLMIYYGFGIFSCRQNKFDSNTWTRKEEFLNQDCILYSMAIQSFLFEKKEEKLKFFLEDYKYNFYSEAYDWLTLSESGEKLKTKINSAAEIFKCWDEFESSYKKRHYSTAINYIDKLKGLEPENSYIYNGSGYSYLLLGKISEAIQEFNNGIELDPYNDVLFNNRGYCYLLLNNLEDSKTDLESVLNMNPLNAYCYRNLGLWNLKAGKIENVWALFTKAQELDPKTELINLCYGIYFHILKNTEKADFHFKKSQILDEHEGKTALLELFGLSGLF